MPPLMIALTFRTNRFAASFFRLLMWVSCCSAACAVTVDDFVPRRYTNSNGVLPYRLFIPTNYTPAQRFPLVLFLHGAGESGTDNRYQLVGQTGALVFASETNQLKHPSFMIAPQCPFGSGWTDTSIRLRVAGLMTALQNEFSIDADRLYITGLSLGGFGTWEYIYRYPGMYAAAIPMSSGDGSGVSSLSPPQIPIWNFHAADDAVVSEINSSALIDLIRRAGRTPIYTRYATGGHAIWTFAYQTPILMDWVYSQSRGNPAKLPPSLEVDGSYGQPISAANLLSQSLTGTADDGSGHATAVTWANYRTVSGVVAAARGTATGTTNWAITNLTLFPTYTNIVVFLGSGTSWYSFLRGNTTFSKTARIIFPPVINTQPATQMVNEGDSVTFGVTPGTLAPVPQFQWRFNGTDIPGATGANFTLTNAHFMDAGIYSVQLSNQFGLTSSSNAVLAVNRFPVARCIDVITSAGLSCFGNASVEGGSLDPDGDPISFSQLPPGPYPPGTNLVQLIVTDSKGASNVCAASVIVLDVTPPMIACQDVTVTNAHDKLSSVVAFNPLVSDNCSVAGRPICIPPSGSVFGLGNHSVLCAASDAAGNVTQCRFNVTVWPGNAPPVAVLEVSPLLHYPDYTNLINVASIEDKARLVFDASSSYDPDDAQFSYSWSEGTNLFSTTAVTTHVLGPGTHEITLMLDDHFPLGITRTNITIEVISTADAVAILIGLVEDSLPSSKARQPLVASLAAAAASFERHNIIAGVNQLQAFENKIRAQVLTFDPVLGNELIRTSQSLIENLAR